MRKLKYRNETKEGFLTINGVCRKPKSKNELFSAAKSAIEWHKFSEYADEPLNRLDEEVLEIYLNHEFIYLIDKSNKIINFNKNSLKDLQNVSSEELTAKMQKHIQWLKDNKGFTFNFI